MDQLLNKKITVIFILCIPCLLTGVYPQSSQYIRTAKLHQPVIYSFNDSVPIHGKFEIAAGMSAITGDFYNPEHIDFYAIFSSPEGRILKINGFYYQRYDFKGCSFLSEGRNSSSVWYEQGMEKCDSSEWRIRFSPDEPGIWSCQLECIIDRTAKFVADKFEFVCLDSGNGHGYPELSANRKHLIQDGKPLYLIGENLERDQSLYVLFHRETGLKYENNDPFGESTRTSWPGICMFEKALNELSKNGGNLFRYTLNVQMDENRYSSRFIYIDEETGSIQYDQANAFRLDTILLMAEVRDIFIKPSLLNYTPFGGSGWKKNPWNREANPDIENATPCDFFQPDTNSNSFRILKYMIRYITARWGYSTNILCWEIMDEIFNVKNDTLACIDNPLYKEQVVHWMEQVAKLIKEEDLNRHLVSSGGQNWGVIDNSGFSGEVYRLHVIDLQEIHLSQFDYENPNAHNPGIFNTLCEGVRISNLFIAENRFFIDPSTSQRIFGPDYLKPVFVNSFWRSSSMLYNPPTDGSFADFMVDPNGFFYHGAIWSSSFSGNYWTAMPFFHISMHPGYFRKQGYLGHHGLTANDIEKVDYNPGQLHHFKQIRDFIGLADLEQSLQPVSNLGSLYAEVSLDGELTIKNGREMTRQIRAVGMQNLELDNCYGWMQDVRYLYGNLYTDHCRYLYNLDPAYRPPALEGVYTLILPARKKECYRADWYRIEKDKVRIQGSHSHVSGRKKVKFEIPEFSGVYGDHAFAVSRVSSSGSYPEFSLNGHHVLQSPDTVPVCGQAPAILSIWDVSCSGRYAVGIQQIALEKDSVDDLYPEGITHFTSETELEIRAISELYGLPLEEGNLYSISVSVPGQSGGYQLLFRIEVNPPTSFYVTDDCSNKVYSVPDSDGKGPIPVAPVGERQGSPVFIEVPFYPCSFPVTISVAECDSTGLLNLKGKAWESWFYEKPGKFDLQLLMDSTPDGLTLLSDEYGNGPGGYYRIRFEWPDGSGNTDRSELLVRKKDCPIND